MLQLIILSICLGSINAIIYDCYTGKPSTRRQLEVYRERNNTQYCVVDVNPCDPNEWKRIDGSCNNLKHPSIGTIRTPTTRFLPPVFSKEYEPRLAKDGGPLPLARVVRTQVLLEGKASDLSITMLVLYVLLFGVQEFNTIHDVVNDYANTTNCCIHKSNYICAPNEIPIDDPVHRYSGIRCQNNTRPQSFQYFGCADFGTTPFARITFASPIVDLTGVYKNENDVINKIRTYKRGLLKTEIENGKSFPPSDPNVDPQTNQCRLNQLEKGETRCNLYHINGVVGPNLCVLTFYNYHNYIANKLYKLNPHWDDERLFFTARDIFIAIWAQIYFYELLPVVLGRKNMIDAGIISSHKGFRDLYDEKILPQMSDEYVYIHRWFHTAQETTLKVYDNDGHYLKKYSALNISTRIGFLAVDDNLDQLMQGSFRQFSGKFDRVIDPGMGERIFGGIQFAIDGSTNHINKGRYLGIQSYAKYRELCSKQHCTSFDSLDKVMSKERIQRLREVFKDIEDVDLLAGAWAENRAPGSRVPYTVLCLMLKQLKRIISSDRHWYERRNRPHAFNEKQLQAVRKATIAGIWCTYAGITKIQPKAFYSISPKNPLTPCTSPRIGNIDLSPWKDNK